MDFSLLATLLGVLVGVPGAILAILGIIDWRQKRMMKRLQGAQAQSSAGKAVEKGQGKGHEVQKVQGRGEDLVHQSYDTGEDRVHQS